MNAEDQGQRPLRIGNMSGFYGDRASALAEMASRRDLDVITGDYLAEVTMFVLGKARSRSQEGGWATTFLRDLGPALDDIVTSGTKIVVNAGGLDPDGLADATRAFLQERGHRLAVAHVTGDDLLAQLPELADDPTRLRHLDTGEPLSSWPHVPLTSNAYLGGFGIARALEAGADIVITGRVADASLVVGPAAWWWGWEPEDLDALAGAVVAGHVIECGAQATGGNYSDFRDLPTGEPGFPIAEITGDGSCVITKHAGTSGAVTRHTVTSQLLYEIGGPDYPNADVVALLDTVGIREIGPDRVELFGTRGSPPPPTTKVAVTAVGLWQNSVFAAVTGLDVEAKISWLRNVLDRHAAVTPGLDEILIDQVGEVGVDADTQEAATTMVRLTAYGVREAAGRAFSSRVVELALSGYPGMYLLAPPQAGSAVGEFWPGLIGQDEVRHRVHHADRTVEDIAPPTSVGGASRPDLPKPSDRADFVDAESSGLVSVPLGAIALTRSGDKGGDANVGIWARDDAAWPWLRQLLTTSAFRSMVPEAEGLVIERHEFDRLQALNFVVRGILGTGAASSTRLDSQAKGLGEWVRSRHVLVPHRLTVGS